MNSMPCHSGPDATSIAFYCGSVTGVSIPSFRPPLMRAQQPALDQTRHPMATRQPVLAGGGLGTHDLALVLGTGQPDIAAPVVGADDVAQLNQCHRRRGQQKHPCPPRSYPPPSWIKRTPSWCASGWKPERSCRQIGAQAAPPRLPVGWQNCAPSIFFGLTVGATPRPRDPARPGWRREFPGSDQRFRNAVLAATWRRRSGF